MISLCFILLTALNGDPIGVNANRIQYFTKSDTCGQYTYVSLRESHTCVKQSALELAALLSQCGKEENANR